MSSRFIYLLFTPILLLVSVPLAFFAALTSAFAFTTLLIRVGIVYFELFISITHNYFTSDGNGARDDLLSSRTTSSKTETTATTSPYRKHHNRQSRSLHSFSSHYTSSNNTATVRSPNGSSLSSPISPNLPPPSPSSFAQGPPNHIHINNLKNITPSPSLLLTTRDFEGVGGWRFQNSDSGDEDDKWSNLNSRLELPTRGTGTGTLTGYSTPELRRKGQGYGYGYGYGKGKGGEQKPQPQHRRSLPGASEEGLGLGVGIGGGVVGGGGGGRKLGFRNPEGTRSRARTPGVEKGDPMDGTSVKRASKSYISLAETERKIWRG